MTVPFTYDDGVALLTSLSAGAWSAWIGSSAVSSGDSLLLAVAVSLNEPLSRSSCVILCVPVQTTESPGASVAGSVGEQPKLCNVGVSVTSTLCRVTLPVFFAVNVYVTICPTNEYLPGFRSSFFVTS